MKPILNKIYLLLALLTLSACSGEEMVETTQTESDGLHTCCLIWNENIHGYDDGMRALHTKQDGDCVYLQFQTANGTVEGKAVYNAAADEWILTYNGSLTVGASAACTAYYFENGSTTATVLSFTPQSLICCDKGATYIKEGNSVKLTAHLTPLTGRIRFKGEVGQTFLFSGIKHYTAYSIKEDELTMDTNGLELTVGEDGYTPYVHALPLSDRTLSIYYNYNTYKTNCDSPILDAGRSGYMLLPTTDSHNGWSLVEVIAPSLSAVTAGVISDVMVEVNATVTSVGNGTLLDAGFVYAETPDPTLTSKKVSCGTTTNLSATLHDLTPETTYYVRAYATNERGTSYSQSLNITTTATPTVPTVRTGAVSEIQANRALVGGTLVHLGAAVESVSQHGHVWSTSPNPTIANAKTTLGALLQTGDYISTLSDLLPNTKYYVRAYATNTVGISYGEQQTFTTPYGNVVLTVTPQNVRYNAATINCTLSDAGGHVIAERGLCWSVTGTPTLSDNVVKSTSTDNTYTLTLTGLAEKTNYYVCAYVKDVNDEVFLSDVLQITTPEKDDSFLKDDFSEDEDWNM